LNNPKSMRCDLLPLLRLGLFVQRIRDSGQHAAGKQGKACASTTQCRESRNRTDIARIVTHHACDRCAYRRADVLGVNRLGDAIRRGGTALFQLPQTDKRFLQIVFSEVFAPRCELLESAVRYARGLYECLVKFSYCVGEQLSGLGTADGRVARHSTDYGANDVSDCLRVDPALL